MLSEVYDIETLSNLFTYTGYSRQEKKYYQFVIWRKQNDYEKLIQHLKRDKLIQIGFNNENFDYPVIHHILNHYEEYKYLDGHTLAEKIYKKSQSVIQNDFNIVADKNKHITQIDLFRIHHFNNLARTTSLKALEIALQIDNVEDMPFDHSYYVRKQSEVEQILSYNKNDVYATNKFLDLTLGDTEHVLYKNKNKISLRQHIGLKYGLSCLNWDDIKIGTELILKLYTNKFRLNPNHIKKLSTPRSIIKLKDCIPSWAKFKSKEFNELLNRFKDLNIYNGKTKGVIDESVIYHGIKIEYGTGGEWRHPY